MAAKQTKVCASSGNVTVVPQCVSDDTSTPHNLDYECCNQQQSQLDYHPTTTSSQSELTFDAVDALQMEIPRACGGGLQRLSPQLIDVTEASMEGPTAASLIKKAKKREEKGLDHVLKALQSLESTDEKLTALCKKYSELLEDHKTMKNNLKTSQRTLSVLSREKEQLQSEHCKAVLAKSKLEGLCRELQRHNKLVKDESVTRAKEDEEKRREVTAKFQTTINDIQTQMNDHYSKNTALREENIELANKLKGLIEQYELREQHIEKVFKSKDIETQLYDARLQQAALEIGEAKEKHLQDKQMLLQDAMEAQKKIFILEEQEKALKSQVAMYSEKYEDFQSTLTRSNDVFSNFKSEMEKMTKKIKKLEKDSVMWRQKWESSNRALLTMAEQKALGDKETSLLQNKLGKLESLCRALQEERKKSVGVQPAGSTSPTIIVDESISSVATETQVTGSDTLAVQPVTDDVLPNGQVLDPPNLMTNGDSTNNGVDITEGVSLPETSEVHSVSESALNDVASSDAVDAKEFVSEAGEEKELVSSADVNDHSTTSTTDESTSFDAVQR